MFNLRGVKNYDTIPRRLEIKDGDIYQTPVESLSSYHYEPVIDEIPKCADITFEFIGVGALIIEGRNGKLIIGNSDNVFIDTHYANNLNGSITCGIIVSFVCPIQASKKRFLFVSNIDVFSSNGTSSSIKELSRMVI